jgi:transcriptional regulator with XRE-family HTH domain
MNNQKYFPEFSLAFKFCLKNKNLSMSEFSDKVGIDTAQLSRYATNSQVPHPKTIRKINSSLMDMYIFQKEDGWSVEFNPHSVKASILVDRVEEEGAAYISELIRRDDPVQLIQFARELLRLALENLDE